MTTAIETTAEKTATAGDWIDSKTATAILGRSARTLATLAHDGHIREHRPPRTRPRYFRPDVERFAPRIGAA